MRARSAVRVILVAAVTLGSGCSLQATTQDASPPRTGGSTDAHERVYRIESAVVPGGGLGGNPRESSFGTVQPDGTYCGVFCAENH
jgi:hypothetical protein